MPGTGSRTMEKAYDPLLKKKKIEAAEKLQHNVKEKRLIQSTEYMILFLGVLCIPIIVRMGNKFHKWLCAFKWYLFDTVTVKPLDM